MTNTRLLTPLRSLWERSSENSRQFVKFALVGGSGTVVNLVTLKLTLLAWSHLIGPTSFRIELFASGLAFCVSVINNYLLNRSWTFRAHGNFGLQFLKFFVVSCSGLLLNELAFWLFRERLGITDMGPLDGTLISQGLAILCVLPFNFFVNKLWSFREKDEPPQAPPVTSSAT